MGKNKSRSRKNFLVLLAVAVVIALLSALLYNELTRPKTFTPTGVTGLASTDDEGYIYPDTVNLRQDGNYVYNVNAADQFMVAWAEAMKNRDTGLYMTLLSRGTKSWILLEAMPELMTLENAYKTYVSNPSHYESAIRERVTESMTNISVNAAITSFKILSTERIEADEDDKAFGIEGYLSVVLLKEYNDGTGDEASTQLIIENGQLRL